MISSACAISSPLEPNTRQDQRGDRYSCGDVSWPPPNACDHVRGSDAKRNHGSDLPRIERPQDEKSGGEKCKQRQGDGAVAPTNLAARSTERRKSRNQSDRNDRAPNRP